VRDDGKELIALELSAADSRSVEEALYLDSSIARSAMECPEMRWDERDSETEQEWTLT
jgi:hypothetical protein